MCRYFFNLLHIYHKVWVTALWSKRMRGGGRGDCEIMMIMFFTSAEVSKTKFRSKIVGTDMIRFPCHIGVRHDIIILSYLFFKKGAAYVLSRDWKWVIAGLMQSLWLASKRMHEPCDLIFIPYSVGYFSFRMILNIVTSRKKLSIRGCKILAAYKVHFLVVGKFKGMQKWIFEVWMCVDKTVVGKHEE